MNVEGRPTFNLVSFEAVRDVAAANNTNIYDSLPDLQVTFGGQPEKYYFRNYAFQF